MENMVPKEHSETGPRIRRRRGKARASLELIAAAHQFLEEAHPTTVRGVCYHLFVMGYIRSMGKNDTSRVSRLLTDAREEGAIPWEWIVDETRAMEIASQWGGLADYANTIRAAYRLDFWAKEHQPRRVEVWSEKGTVRGVLAPVLDQYGVGFRVMHGFSSATTVNNIAEDRDGRPLIALYVGDWDPSGLYMSELDLPQRLLEYGGSHVQVRRVALSERDVMEDDLPSFPADDKSRDPRHAWFTKLYGEECWEIDALHPNTLRERVAEEITNLIEPAAWTRCLQAQEAERESLRAFIDGCPAFKDVA